MMKNRSVDEIRRILKKHGSELKEKYGIKKIGVFGSYVRGEQKKGSDIDILVAFYPGVEMDLITFVELEEYLFNLLGIKVDLVMKSALKPRVGKHILKEDVYI